MAPVGHLLLIFGLAACVYGFGASVHGGLAGARHWVDSARRAMYALFGMSAIAFVILDVAFVSSNFSYEVVASASSTTTPTLYRAAAIWSTQQGSLLLWLMLLSGWASLALLLTRRRVREILPWAQAVLFALCGFFAGLTVLFADPFRTLPNPPPEGNGLDPLLRHATMMVHPPMLYSGYTLLMVPFAFAVGALISGRLGAEWIQVTRRFALGAWLCLGIGILLGARWSYTELGWGGYWAWDPVENAALMPWLCATAFIHSIMIQEKRGMLKVWNVSLVLATGALAIIGTFLVRSGILSSIHAFVSDPTLNIAFVALIAVVVVTSLALVIYRSEQLKSDARLDSLLSREAMFLLQNLVLVAVCAVVFWLTFFPLISEAITGNTMSVGPPAFRPFVVPLAIVVVLLSGIGPVIAWRRVTVAKLRRSFAFPLAAGAATAVVLLVAAGGSGQPFATAMIAAGAFALAVVAQEFQRGAHARRAMTGEPVPVALGRLVRRNRRRYGGYIVHAGVALAMIGVAASTSFHHPRYAWIGPGQSVLDGGYRFTYERPTASATPEKISFGALLRVTRGGHYVTTLHTSYGLYPSQNSLAGPIGRFFNGSTESQVGLSSSATRDLWAVISPNTGNLQGLIAEGNAVLNKAVQNVLKLPPSQQVKALNEVYTLRDAAIRALAQRFVTHPWKSTFLIIVSPLVTWLWAGAILGALGGLVALWPLPPPRRVRVQRSIRPPAGAPEARGVPEVPTGELVS